jgi:hypothetical protein
LNPTTTNMIDAAITRLRAAVDDDAGAADVVELVALVRTLDDAGMFGPKPGQAPALRHWTVTLGTRTADLYAAGGPADNLLADLIASAGALGVPETIRALPAGVLVAHPDEHWLKIIDAAEATPRIGGDDRYAVVIETSRGVCSSTRRWHRHLADAEARAACLSKGGGRAFLVSAHSNQALPRHVVHRAGRVFYPDPGTDAVRARRRALVAWLADPRHCPDQSADSIAASSGIYDGPSSSREETLRSDLRNLSDRGLVALRSASPARWRVAARDLPVL